MRVWWRSIVLVLAGLVALPVAGWAQSSPGFSTGQTPTAAQWNGYFSGKVDTTAIGNTVAGLLSGLVPSANLPIGIAGGVAGLSSTGVTSACPGIVANGTTNDTAALAACANAATNNGTVTLPPGDMHLNSFPNPYNNVFYNADGTTFNGGNPMQGIGTGVTQTVYGGLFYDRANAPNNAAPVIRIDSHDTATGGSQGTTSSLLVNTFVPSGAPIQYPWGITAVTHSLATNGANVVGIAAYSYKDVPVGSDPVPAAPVWAVNFDSTDSTGDNSSVSGALIGDEQDIDAAGGLDDGGASNGNIPAGSGIRVGVDLVMTGGASYGWGYRIGGATNTLLSRGFSINNATVTTAGYDASLANMQSGADAFRMAAGMKFALDGSGTNTISDVSGTYILASGSTQLFNVNLGTGAVAALGSVTGAGLVSSVNVNATGYVMPLLGVDWENTAVIKTSYASGVLTDYNGATVLRSISTSTGNMTVLGSIAPSTTGGIVGTTAANNATAGSDGEYLSAINSAGTTMVTATPLNLTSLALTAGDWDVSGSGQLTCSSAAATNFGIGVNTTSATFPSLGQFASLTASGLSGTTMSIPTTRFNVSTSTTIYAVGQQTCSSGTLTGYAMLRARRVR